MGGREWCQKTHLPAPTAISLRKSLRFRKRPIQAGRDRKRKSLDQRETDRQTEPFPAPSLCMPQPAPTSSSSAGWGGLGSERCRTCPGATQQCQLPSLSYPISGSLLLQEALIVVQGRALLGLGTRGGLRAKAMMGQGPWPGLASPSSRCSS